MRRSRPQWVLTFASVVALVVVPVLHSGEADLASTAPGTCPICVAGGRARSLLPTLAHLGVRSVAPQLRLCLREVRAVVGIPPLAQAPPRAPPFSA